MRDWFISAAEDSVSFSTALSRSNSLLVGLGPGSRWGNYSTLRFCPRQMTTHEVILEEIVEGIWISVPQMPRHFTVWTWSTGPINCSLFNRSKDSGIRVCTRLCMLSAYRSSTSENIIHIWGCSVGSSDSNFMDECSFFTNSFTLDFCSQCFELLLNFTHTVSSCGLGIPWCFYHRSHFFWLKFSQHLIM